MCDVCNWLCYAGESEAIWKEDSAGKCKTLTVNTDINSGSDPNCFNFSSHGVIPVAILGSDTFDVLDIDTSTLFFAGLDVERLACICAPVVIVGRRS